jgi:hypothetical protein
MRELLERSRVRFAISGEMRDAYESKYDLEFGVLPPTVLPHFVEALPLEPPRNVMVAERGAIVGNIWGQHWLNLLRGSLRGSGLRLDWFCNSGGRWLQSSEAELAADGLVMRGALSEDNLKRELRDRPFAVVPSRTLDDQDDRRAIATLSLPSRVVFVAMAANTPVLVLGSKDTAAARFVEKHGLGVHAAYDPAEVTAAIAVLLDPSTQRKMRARAAELAPSFSSAGLRDWVWRSTEAGRPFDRRFEDLFPRSRSWGVAAETVGEAR